MECLGWGLEVEAFSWRVVEAVGVCAQVGLADGVEVGFAWQDAAQATDDVLHAALLPWASNIAEEGADAEAFVQAVMLGELGSIVEADGLAQGMGHGAWGEAAG